jgi:hypothetical protein
MDFNIITENVKKAFDGFVANIVAYIIGALIVAIGSCLVITAAPLMYGLYTMVLKGTRGEKVEIKDVLYGFSSGSIFIRSWIGLIGLMVVPICIMIVYVIISIIIGLVAPTSIALMIMMVLYLLMIIVFLVIGLFLYYTLFIYVMTPSENIVYAIKESIAIAKANLIMVLLTMLISGILGIFTITIPLGWLFAAYMLKEFKPDLKDNSGI